MRPLNTIPVSWYFYGALIVIAIIVLVRFVTYG